MSSNPIVAALILLTGIAGCVPVPLGDPEKSKVRKEYVGLWRWNDDYLFDVQKFDSRAYVIDWMQIDSATGKSHKRFLVKAWITEIKGTQFFTLKVLQVDSPNNPSRNGDQLTMGKLALKDGRLLISLFESDAVKNVKTSAQLRGILEKRHKDASLYDKPMKLERVKKTDKHAKRILDAFHRK